eukprot:GILJ01035689.1.p2 GENE.GILJ01035689.1~~GILJ01035689.1.p2  ORF type:complete len:131 (-),score=13.77 GILJ01035689.1:456-848(-)
MLIWLNEAHIPHTAELISFEKLLVAPPKDAQYVFAIAQRLYDGDLNDQGFPGKFLPEKIKDLAMTLSVLWGEGICHLDVKPGNIFWRHTSSSSVEVVLGDFGFAIRFTTLDDMFISSVGLEGTPHFFPRK